jgi:putative DNA primase/helicase
MPPNTWVYGLSDGIWLRGCNHQSQYKPDKPWKKEGDKKAAKYRSPLGEYDAMLPTHPTDPITGMT